MIAVMLLLLIGIVLMALFLTSEVDDEMYRSNKRQR